MRDFSLISVVQLSMARLRVTFSQFPLAFDDQNLHDAQNIANYTLTGGGVVHVVLAKSVSADPSSFDLWLDGNLPVGLWTLTVGDIQTAFGGTLTNFTETFTITTITTPTNIADLTAEDLLRKNFNPTLVGPIWDALIAALATGDNYNQTNAATAFDQLFISTASGKNLDRKTADIGLTRPTGVGMNDSTYRHLAISLHTKKLTQNALWAILEIFYGPELCRAYITSLTGPFDLNDLDDLTLVLDEKQNIQVIFNQIDFSNISVATPDEVITIINRTFVLNRVAAYALVVDEVVWVFSGSCGLGSVIRAVGGKAQNILQFQDRLVVYTGGTLPTWDIALYPATGRVRFTSTDDVSIDLSLVRIDDYVNVYGSEFTAGNRGSFSVVDVWVGYVSGVLTQYFEIVNPNAVTQTGLVQVADRSLYYFRPTKQTIKGKALVVQDPNGIRLDLPATTRAVNRRYLTASYLNEPAALVPSTLIRAEGGGVTLTTTGSHGLTVGQQIEIIGAHGSTTQPSVTTGSMSPYTTNASLGSLWSPLVASTDDRKDHTATKLDNNQVLVVGGYTDAGTAWLDTAELFKITATDSVGGAPQYTYEWNSATDLPATRGRHAALLMQHPLMDTKVLVTGGWDGSTHANCYLYTPATDTWAATGSFTVERYWHSLVLLQDNTALAIGGSKDASITATVELFSPTAGTWSTVNPMGLARYRHNAVVLQNGSVLVTGGLITGGVATNRCELYVPGTNTWTAVGRMSWARAGHQAYVMDDNRVLVVGGVGYLPRNGSGSPVAIAQCEIFDPRTNVWSPGGLLKTARNYPSLGRVRNTLIVVGGGTTTTEILDLTRMTWSLGRGTLSAVRDVAVSVTLDNGAILLTNGVLSATAQNVSYLFIPGSEKTWGGGLNGQYKILTVPSSTTLTYATPDHLNRTVASGTFTANKVEAPTLDTLGPHVLDPHSGVGTTGTESTLTAPLAKGLKYTYIDVTDATSFPDAEGWLCFGFGGNTQVGPVQYHGRLSNTRLKLDYRFTFPNAIATGALVTLLVQKGPWLPADPPSVGSFYVTGSNAGLAAVSSLMDETIAADVQINKNIIYPGDRGLGGEGLGVTGDKTSDVVDIWG